MYKDMRWWTEIRRQVLVEGVSKREILRQTGMHWRTLEKVLTHSEPPGYRLRSARPRLKLGPFLGRIEQILREDEGVPRKQRHTAKRIFARLREEGYGGGYTQVNWDSPYQPAVPSPTRDSSVSGLVSRRQRRRDRGICPNPNYFRPIRPLRAGIRPLSNPQKTRSLSVVAATSFLCPVADRYPAEAGASSPIRFRIASKSIFGTATSAI